MTAREVQLAALNAWLTLKLAVVMGAIRVHSALKRFFTEESSS